MVPDESDPIAPLDEGLQFMPSDDEEQWHWKMRSIYRVPARITALNHKAYQPQVVSFGPYHHGEDHLLPMEEHKRRMVRHFLKWSKKPIECFFKSLREVGWDLEESYDVLDPKWKAGSGEGTAPVFLELMITDGCFMLEILRFTANEVDDYGPSDPILSDHGKLYRMSDIWQVMLMLENQLPMLVLDRLVAVESDGEKVTFLDFGRSQDEKILQDARSVIRFLPYLCLSGTCNERMGKGLHLLDICRNGMLMEPEKKDEVERKYSLESIQLASATELSEHGIRFERSNTNSLNDISFASRVLTLPRIWVDSKAESRFLNLLAFERFHAGAGTEVMSYIYCMEKIISNGWDIPLLRAKGIIVNFMENDEAVAKMFNSLANVVIINPNCSLVDVLKKVNEYYNKRWNMWRANLIHTLWHPRNGPRSVKVTIVRLPFT